MHGISLFAAQLFVVVIEKILWRDVGNLASVTLQNCSLDYLNNLHVIVPTFGDRGYLVPICTHHQIYIPKMSLIP